MPECKHEAHCQFEGLSPCYPCRSESPRTCIVVSLFTEALRRTVHRTGHRMQSMSLRKDCLVTPHALFRCSVTPSAHTTVCLVMSASQGRWKRGYWERAWFPSVESAGYAQPRCRETSALLVPGEHYKHAFLLVLQGMLG